MLVFHPKNSFTWKFDVVQKHEGSEGRRAFINLSSWSNRGVILTDEKTIDVGSLGIFSKTYAATLNGEDLLAAERISWLHRGYIMNIGSREWRLEPNSSFRREFHLSLNGEIVGRVRPDSALRRSGNADFPDDLPFEMQLICLWLVLAAWKQASNAMVVASG